MGGMSRYEYLLFHWASFHLKASSTENCGNWNICNLTRGLGVKEGLALPPPPTSGFPTPCLTLLVGSNTSNWVDGGRVPLSKPFCQSLDCAEQNMFNRQSNPLISWPFSCQIYTKKLLLRVPFIPSRILRHFEALCTKLKSSYLNN